MESKTILQWLNELKEPVRSEAIENCKNCKPHTGATKEDNIEDALIGGFFWDNTTQGVQYWDNIYCNINDYIQ